MCKEHALLLCNIHENGNLVQPISERSPWHMHPCSRAHPTTTFPLQGLAVRWRLTAYVPCDKMKNDHFPNYCLVPISKIVLALLPPSSTGQMMYTASVQTELQF